MQRKMVASIEEHVKVARSCTPEKSTYTIGYTRPQNTTEIFHKVFPLNV